MDRQRLESLKRIWPLGLCWFAMLLGSWRAMYYMEHSGYNAIAQTMIVGYFCGQFGLATIIGGLLGRTWLAGWMLAVLLTWITMALCMFAWSDNVAMDVGERLAIGAIVPSIALAACAPLILMRGLGGWSLTLSKQTAIVKERAGVEDLLLMSVAAACSLSLLRIVSVFARGFDTQMGMLMAATFFGFSLLFVMPATAATFRARSWGQRWLCWSGIAVAAFIGCIAMNVLMTPGGWNAEWDELSYIALGIGACGLTMALGAWAILASGFQLTRFARATSPASEPGQESYVEDFNASLSSQRTRWQARLLTAGLILVTCLASGWLAYADQRRLAFFESIQQDFGKEGLYRGGTVALAGDKVISVTVGENTTDETFYRYKRFGDLQELSLAHSRVTDRIVDEITEFPSLNTLDLSDTAISDVGLEHLRLEHLRRNFTLTELSVARTRVSPSKAFEAAASMLISELDISELDVDDEELQGACGLQTVRTLALRGNPITDKGIAKLMQSPPLALSKLDLSNTSIDGSGLRSGSFSILILDGTQITDANLIAIMQAHPGISVSVKNTAITAQVLKVANNAQVTLSLGGGQIEEGDLASLGPSSFGALRLNGPEFTGESLGNFIHGQWLDVSHSGVTDAAFFKLKQLDGVYLSSLNIAHTQVTDAVLPIIKQLGCYELDVRDTKITADGLLRHAMAGGRIIVDLDQFTPAELVSLRQRFDVAIGGKSIWSANW